MSSADRNLRRRTLAMLAVAGAMAAAGGGLAGCGFHPLYAPPAREQSAFDANLAAITVDPIPDRIGQLLANSLRDSFNPGSGVSVGKQYGLTVILTTSRSEVGIRSDGTASRILYVVNARIVLRDLHDGHTLFQTLARANTAFDNFIANEYATVVAEQDAQSRAVLELSNEIRSRLAVYMRQRSETARNGG
jgi:LPS-assembly lipoprotein